MGDGAAARANSGRNGGRTRGRRARWAGARDELWALVDNHMAVGSRVAVVGAGNGDDVPLGRIARRASQVALVDVDGEAAERAIRRVPRRLRSTIEVVEHDVTLGATDRIVEAAVAGRPGQRVDLGDPAPLPVDGCDLVIGDLLYSQLLYPALLDSDASAPDRRTATATHGSALTRALVRRLHVTAPAVVHVHDPACWGNGYDQPLGLDEVLDGQGEGGPEAALRLARDLKGPREADPRRVLDGLGIPVLATRLWRWPFTTGVDYLAVGTVAGRPR